MKKFLIFFVITFIFLITPLSLANQYDISISQIQDKLVYKEKIMLNNQKEVSLFLPDEASGISASTTYQQKGNERIFNAKEFEISYITKELNKAGNELYFVKKIEAPFDSNISLKLILDSGYIIDKSDIYPTGEITTDGEHIIITWNFQNKKQYESIPIFLTIKNTTPPYLKYILWITLMIGILAILVYILPKITSKFKKSEKPKVIIKKIVKVIEREKKTQNQGEGKASGNRVGALSIELEKHLLDEERKMLEELRKADRNEMWQKQLQTNLNLSKAKTSRLIRNLETRQLITKIPFGNTNKIILK